MEKLSSSSHFLDLGGLDNLRAQAQKDEKGALKKSPSNLKAFLCKC